MLGTHSEKYTKEMKMNHTNLRNSLLLSLLVCTGTALAAEKNGIWRNVFNNAMPGRRGPE